MSPDAAAEVFERASRMIEGYGEEMVRLQGELVAIDAVGPTNHGPGEAAKAEVFLRWLKTLDLLIEREDARDERVAGGLRPNILAYTPEKTPRLWVIGHLDVVPPGEGSLWNADPFTLVRDGDKLFGRGVSDDHQALVMGYFAAKACRELKETEGFVPSLGLGIMAVSDEETGSEFGLKHVLNQRPELFSAEDLIVIPDAGNPRGTLIEVAEKSMLWLKFRARGRQVHASRPDLGNNALAGGARLILALEELARLFAEEDPLFDPPPVHLSAHQERSQRAQREHHPRGGRVLPGLPDPAPPRGGPGHRGGPGDLRPGGRRDGPHDRGGAHLPQGLGPGNPGRRARGPGHPGRGRGGAGAFSRARRDRRGHRGRLPAPAGAAGRGLDERPQHGPPAQRILPSLGHDRGHQGPGPHPDQGWIGLFPKGYLPSPGVFARSGSEEAIPETTA